MRIRRSATRTLLLAALTLTGIGAGSAQAGSPPPGANDWSCTPSAAHPRPVVLVHATLTNMATNWRQVSPLLAKQGYCVFAFDYGATNPALPGVGGLDAVSSSGRVMAAFIDRVRAATGAAKVDLVGHSQGGMLLKYYISALGGGTKVDRAVAFAPTIHGTTLSGLTTLLKVFPGITSSAIAAPGALDQAAGSPFMDALNALPDTAGGAQFTVVSTLYDLVVTPVSSQRPTGPGTRWVVLQQLCGLDFVDHVGMAFDLIAQRVMLNTLDPAHPQPIRCRYVAPVLGG